MKPDQQKVVMPPLGERASESERGEGDGLVAGIYTTTTLISKSEVGWDLFEGIMHRAVLNQDDPTRTG